MLIDASRCIYAKISDSFDFSTLQTQRPAMVVIGAANLCAGLAGNIVRLNRLSGHCMRINETELICWMGSVNAARPWKWSGVWVKSGFTDDYGVKSCNKTNNTWVTNIVGLAVFVGKHGVFSFCTEFSHNTNKNAPKKTRENNVILAGVYRHSGCRLGGRLT